MFVDLKETANKLKSHWEKNFSDSTQATDLNLLADYNKCVWIEVRSLQKQNTEANQLRSFCQPSSPKIVMNSSGHKY